MKPKPSPELEKIFEKFEDRFIVGRLCDDPECPKCKGWNQLKSQLNSLIRAKDEKIRELEKENLCLQSNLRLQVQANNELRDEVEEWKNAVEMWKEELRDTRKRMAKHAKNLREELKSCKESAYKKCIKLIEKRIQDKKEGYEIVTTNLNKRLILAQRTVLEQVLNDLKRLL